MCDPTMADPELKRRTVLAGVAATVSLGPSLAWGQSAPAEGGIGGTGIVGTLSGEGGLSVNGRLLQVTARTRAFDVFGRISLEALRAGDSVTIEADGRADRSLRARRIAVLAPVIGFAAQQGGQIRVNGVPVTGPRSVLARAEGRVAVQGIWRGDSVVASRIDPAPDGADVIAGEMARQGDRMGGVEIDFAARSSAPPSESFAVLTGRFDGTRFAAADTDRGRFSQPRVLRHLSVEGYLEPVPRAPGFAVSGLGHSFDRQARLEALVGRRSLIEGRYDGDFRAARGLILPEAPAARVALLSERLIGGAPGISLR